VVAAVSSRGLEMIVDFRRRAVERKMQLKLVVGNKNYSSWSMRPWVLLRQAGIPFEEVQLRFDQDVRVIGIEKYSRAGKVPVLMVDGEAVWDTLAIAETAAELFPEKKLWPEDARARRMARSACAEMHSGFQGLRGKMPMNIRASHPGKGLTPESKKDIDRVVALWAECREKYGSGGPLLFGDFSIADAYFAPVVMRFRTYAVDVPRSARDYCAAVESLAAVREWIDAARKEKEFVAADEPYAKK
jgi:glutathione S-transferase